MLPQLLEYNFHSVLQVRRDARASETWAHNHEIEYLDCAITGNPSSIGTPRAHILVSGREAVFQKAEPTLRLLAGNYQETSAPLELWAGSIGQIAQHAQDSHIHAKFPQLVARLFQKAMNDGYDREEVSALFKVLQK